MVALNENFAPENPAPGLKNCVGDFFCGAGESRRGNRLSTRRGIGENGPVATTTASGIPYWPNRDPIEERGGMNLYGFIYNDPIHRIDKLGKFPGSTFIHSGITYDPQSRQSHDSGWVTATAFEQWVTNVFTGLVANLTASGIVGSALVGGTLATTLEYKMTATTIEEYEWSGTQSWGWFFTNVTYDGTVGNSLGVKLVDMEVKVRCIILGATSPGANVGLPDSIKFVDPDSAFPWP